MISSPTTIRRTCRWRCRPVPPACLLLALSLLCPAAEKEPASRSILTVDEPVFDWGVLYQGEHVDHTFVLRNSGQKPLTIEKVLSDCGCAVVEDDLQDIALKPGERRELKLLVDTTKLPAGQAIKTTVVKTDADSGNLTLLLRGEVRDVLIAEPSQISLSVVRDDQLRADLFSWTLRSGVEEPLEIKSLRSKEGLVSATVRKESPAGVFTVDLRPTLDAEALKRAQIDEILVKTAFGGREIELSFSASILVKDRIQVFPSRSFFFSRALTRKLGEEGAHPPVRTLTIRSIGGADHEFRIRRVTAREKRFLPSIETVREGREYRLKLEMLPPPEDFTGRILRDTVTVETDDPLVPEIRLPGMAQI